MESWDSKPLKQEDLQIPNFHWQFEQVLGDRLTRVLKPSLALVKSRILNKGLGSLSIPIIHH